MQIECLFLDKKTTVKLSLNHAVTLNSADLMQLDLGYSDHDADSDCYFIATALKDIADCNTLEFYWPAPLIVGKYRVTSIRAQLSDPNALPQFSGFIDLTTVMPATIAKSLTQALTAPLQSAYRRYLDQVKMAARQQFLSDFAKHLQEAAVNAQTTLCAAVQFAQSGQTPWCYSQLTPPVIQRLHLADEAFDFVPAPAPYFGVMRSLEHEKEQISEFLDSDYCHDRNAYKKQCRTAIGQHLKRQSIQPSAKIIRCTLIARKRSHGSTPNYKSYYPQKS